MKKFMITLALAGFAMFSTAQETVSEVVVPTKEHSVVTNSFGSNWFIAANLGANLYHGTTMTLTKNSENIFNHAAFALDLYFGKWHTPGFGWRAGYRGLGMKAFDKTSKNKDWESVSYLNFHFDAMFNLSNLIGGYRADRVWNVIPYAGLGWAARGQSQADTDASMGHKSLTGSLAVNAGILQNFRLSNRWAFNVEIGATILRNGFSSKPAILGHDAMWTATVGLTYNLGRVGWDNAPDVEALQGIYAGMIDDLQNELDDALAANEEKQAQIKDLENEKAALESEMAEMSKVKPINVHESIFFNLASAKIVSKKEELNIKAYAEAAAAVGAKLAVVGYADISGSTEYNIKLSQRRAEAVAELLRANGAEVVVVSGNGETEEYKERFLNRRVIIKVYEE